MVELESCVCGYHVYKNIWSPTVGQEYNCEREEDNTEDSYAVAIISGGNTVGHVPRSISAAYSLFLQRLGTITCRVTGSRHYSQDLPQGGLELPCVYTFSGEAKLISKIKKLLLPVDVLKSPEKKKQKLLSILKKIVQFQEMKLNHG